MEALEKWAVVASWPDYEISSYSRLRRIKSEKPNRVGRIAKGTRDKNGYLRYHLRMGDRDKVVMAHRLVAEAFIPNPDNLPLVLHGAAGATDSSVENLRWGTNSDNMQDKKRDGTDYELNKTHCPKGHPYSPENTYWADAAHTSRKCKTCHNRRRRKGEIPDTNPLRNFKLTWDQIPRIRQLISEGVPDYKIAEQYGVSPTTISCVRRGKTWKPVVP